MFSRLSGSGSFERNSNHFSRIRYDPFQVSMLDSDIQTKLKYDSSDNIDGGFSDDIFNERCTGNFISDDHKVPIVYHEGLVSMVSAPREKLPEDVEYHFIQKYDEAIIPYLEKDVETLVDNGFAREDAINIVERVRSGRHGFVGNIEDIIGKSKGSNIEKYISNAEKFHEALENLESIDDKGKKSRISDILKGKTFPGMDPLKYAAVRNALVINHGEDSLDHFDASSVDWNEDVEMLVRKAKAFGPRFTSMDDEEMKGRFSNNQNCYLVSA